MIKKLKACVQHAINQIPFSFKIKLGIFELNHSPYLSRKRINLSVYKNLCSHNYFPLNDINFSKIYSLDRVCIKNSVNSVLTSYLPWVSNSNCILFVNHFFAQNYGIRTPLIIQTSIIDNFGKVHYSNANILKPYQSKLISLKSSLFKDKARIGAYIYIQCYNPMIRRGHGGHLGYYRMHGFYEKKSNGNKCFSAVHSMPYPSNSFSFKKIDKARLSPRGVSPVQDKKINYLNYFHHPIFEKGKGNFSINNTLGFERIIKFGKPFGFILNHNLKSHALSGIWHDGPAIAQSKNSSMKKPELMNRSTATYVPRYEFNAPFLFFDPLSLGFTEPCNISIFFKGKHGITKKSFAYNGKAQCIDTSTLLSPSKHPGPMTIKLEFLDIQHGFDSPLMVHVIFRDGMKGTGDCNHTASGFTNTQPSGSSRRGMVIWAPYFQLGKFSNKFIWEYSLHNVFSMDKLDKSMPVKVRINTDTGYEYVFNAGPIKAETVFTMSCSFLDSISNFKSHTNRSATIQFECQGSSLQGSFYVFEPKSGLCGTDHLTGG